MLKPRGFGLGLGKLASASCIWPRSGLGLVNLASKNLLSSAKQEFVRPRWPYDMPPSARAAKYMCVIVIR